MRKWLINEIIKNQRKIDKKKQILKLNKKHVKYDEYIDCKKSMK